MSHSVVADGAPAPLYAAVDIGTNTLLALVGRLRTDGTIDRISDRGTITRLGEGVDRDRKLRPEAMERALSALRQYVTEAKNLGVRAISAVATSAVRDAENRDEFLAPVRDLVGDDVHVISGRREAYLSFMGAADGTGVARGTPALVFDIGGGSTEIVAGRIGERPGLCTSLAVGSVRLTERFCVSDPVSPAEVDLVIKAISVEMAQLGDPPAHDVLIGLAGTVTTVAAIDSAWRNGSSRAYDVHGTSLTLEAAERTAHRLATLPLAARRTLPGLDPRRADVIVAGALIVVAVMRWSERSSLVVSNGGVRVGLLIERALRHCNPDPDP